MPKRLLSLLLLGLVAVATSIWIVACQPATTTPPQSMATTPTSTYDTSTSASGGGGTKDELKMGVLLPATGDLSSIGAPMVKAIDFLVETVNACGGVLGKPIKEIKEDDRTQPAAGVEAMNKLVKVDKVGAVVGAFASSVSTAGLAIAVPNKVVMISPGSTSPVFTERAKKGEFKGYWARTAPPDTTTTALDLKKFLSHHLKNSAAKLRINPSPRATTLKPQPLKLRLRVLLVVNLMPSQPCFIPKQVALCSKLPMNWA
jgi:neutral amino acid transport system substrate-binding protein